jgi:hypothetical protein
MKAGRMFNRCARIIFGISSLGAAILFLLPKAILTPPLVALSSVPSPSAKSPSTVKQIAVARPPLGWSSWNSFSNTINSQIVMEQAKAMVTSGMQKAGYQYINIDEGWWLGLRDARGNIVVDASQWPALQPGEHAGDMSNIVRFIHSLGLKAGIYTDAGEAGCGFYGPDLGPPMPHTGAEGYYDQDFLQFAQWGFDYVKVDWCGGSKENLDPAVQYTAVAHAINRAETITGRRLYYSICDWGNNSPWTWAPGIGDVPADIWRTSGDIVAPIVANSPNSSRVATFNGVLSNFDKGIHPDAQHTGFYNDPDMMVLGMPGLSDAQNRTHMSLWAISGAPLLVGADLTKLSETTASILTNPDVLAIDQDPLGLQAIKVNEAGIGLQVWSKLLAEPGSRAVVLLNRRSTSAEMTLRWNDLGLDPSAQATVKDVWDGKELGSLSTYSATVPAGDAMLLLVRSTDAKATSYAAASPANTLSGGAIVEACGTCASGRKVALGGEKTLTFKIAPFQRPIFVQIQYINQSGTPLTAQLRVGDSISTNVLFPATGAVDQVGSITVEVEPGHAGNQTTLVFSSPCARGPALESVSVLSSAD